MPLSIATTRNETPAASSHCCNIWRARRAFLRLWAIVGRRCARRHRIVGVTPKHAADVVQRNADAPTVRSRPEEGDREQREEATPDEGVRPEHAEVDDDDHGGHRQPIAEDREGPGIARIALEDEVAMRTLTHMVCPSLEERALPTMRTSLAPAPSEGRENPGPASS